MSSSDESTNFEETDSAPDNEGLVESERCHGGRGRKKNTKSNAKKNLKRKGAAKTEKVDEKKRKVKASSPAGDNLEETQPPAEEATPAPELCPCEKLGKKLMGSLLKRNVVISPTCSPCNKNLLECIVETVMESLLGDEMASSYYRNENFLECFGNSFVENLVKIFGEIQFPGNSNQDQTPFDAFMESLVASLPASLAPPPASD
jgi:hypothetical protein